MPPAIESWTPTLTLRCLSSFEVVVDGEALPRSRWQGHPAGAIRMQRLLLHLAHHRSPQPISAIARYVWPDSWDQIDLAQTFTTLWPGCAVCLSRASNRTATRGLY
jgi:hypothetical protein